MCQFLTNGRSVMLSKRMSRYFPSRTTRSLTVFFFKDSADTRNQISYRRYAIANRKRGVEQPALGSERICYLLFSICYSIASLRRANTGGSDRGEIIDSRTGLI